MVHAAAEAEDSGTEGIEAGADDTELSKQIGPKVTRISLAGVRRETTLSDFSCGPLAFLFATFRHEYRRW